MKWTTWQWAAFAWLFAVFIGVFGAPFVARGMLPNFWFVLVQPFVTASLLGIWLTAGIGPIWMRILGMLAGQILSVWGMAMVLYLVPEDITSGLAATTAFTALAMLGLGCLGSLLPIRLTWNVRFSLWEIVISVGLIGVALAAARLLSVIYQWDGAEWASTGRMDCLVFALFTSLLMAFALLPMIVDGHRTRWLAVGLLLSAIVLIPPLEVLTFQLLEQRDVNLFRFYTVHFGQTVMALAIMIPLILAFPGVLVRQTRPEAKPSDHVEPKHNVPTSQQDFADMQ
ncbi:hypothetical protein AB1K70_22880 [Bremerella sp. JC770]|uniref:hypothetical protein n=1 Tax=Bremerella sp. JC770 TaxID=3232137 RepID=UPI0034593227